ncbi:MAG TPA: biotin/lipoyl-binding protein, partial [Pseudonocardiaceae bacterium]|nr:biotin/lipoyl-binding protein [Pseudonocardiaceae bacterium]
MIVTAAIVVVIAGGGVAAWAATRPANAATTTGFATVAPTTLRQTLSSSGTIEPADQSNLNFAVSGQVTAVDVAQGQHVTKGQALATVNSASLAANVAQAQATLSSDQSRLSSDQDSDASSTQLDADQAAVNADQNQLAEARTALSEATLTSPIDGTVASIDLTLGQQVAGGGSSGDGGSGSGGGNSGGGSGSGSGGSGGSGGASDSSSSSSSSNQIVVISEGTYVVNGTVDDTEVGQVKAGDQAVITPDGSTTPVFGTVTSVAMLASSSSSVPSYPVTIGVTGTPSGLHPGASATVQIIVRQLTNVLAVPTVALHFQNGKAVVYREVAGKQVTTSVTTGMTSNGETQILSGLSNGDQIVVPSIQRGGATTTGGRGGSGGRGGGLGGAGGGRFGGGGGFG